MENTTTHESDHVYIVISPNPFWASLSAYNYEDKDGAVSTVHDPPQTLHFIKVGDEKHFGHRVSEYNTHNPESTSIFTRLGQELIVC